MDSSQLTQKMINTWWTPHHPPSSIARSADRAEVSCSSLFFVDEPIGELSHKLFLPYPPHDFPESLEVRGPPWRLGKSLRPLVWGPQCHYRCRWKERTSFWALFWRDAGSLLEKEGSSASAQLPSGWSSTKDSLVDEGDESPARSPYELVAIVVWRDCRGPACRLSLGSWLQK